MVDYATLQDHTIMTLRRPLTIATLQSFLNFRYDDFEPAYTMALYSIEGYRVPLTPFHSNAPQPVVLSVRLKNCCSSCTLCVFGFFSDEADSRASTDPPAPHPVSFWSPFSRVE
jgi:hypothetical protein